MRRWPDSGVIVGMQDEKAGMLLDDVGADIPQRFSWCSSIDPDLPDDALDYPRSLDWSTPAIGADDRQMGLSPTVAAEVKRRDVARGRGELERHDHQAHSDLTQLRVAGCWP
jgi:hypothetical protein